MRTGCALVPSARSSRRCASDCARRRCGELGALSAPGRRRGGEGSRGWALCAGDLPLVETRSWNAGFDDVLTASCWGCWIETVVNFKSSLWMQPGRMRACFWTWLCYIRAGIWSCAAFTKNSDKLFLAASFLPSCFFYLLFFWSEFRNWVWVRLSNFLPHKVTSASTEFRILKRNRSFISNWSCG